MVNPQHCHYHLNTCRDSIWADYNCFIDHYIYLSKTSNLKIGITKHKQIPSRWIEQGATQAIPIIKVKSRYQAGLIETIMKNYIIDKTNWKKMILCDSNSYDIVEKKNFLLKKTIKKILLMNKKLNSGIELLSCSKPINIKYPFIAKSFKIKNIKIDMSNIETTGVLLGMKGYYLVFDIGVINIKKILGYELSIKIY